MLQDLQRSFKYNFKIRIFCMHVISKTKSVTTTIFFFSFLSQGWLVIYLLPKVCYQFLLPKVSFVNFFRAKILNIITFFTYLIFITFKPVLGRFWNSGNPRWRIIDGRRLVKPKSYLSERRRTPYWDLYNGVTG